MSLLFDQHDVSWHAHAACVGLTPLFFPERGEPTREAKAVCAGCPVRQACLDYAITTNQKSGLWGGTSERERRRVRRQGALTRAVATVEHCPNGHPWDDYYDLPDGRRRCRHCVRDATAKYRRARGIPERGISADGQQLADVTQIRRPA